VGGDGEKMKSSSGSVMTGIRNLEQEEKYRGNQLIWDHLIAELHYYRMLDTDLRLCPSTASVVYQLPSAAHTVTVTFDVCPSGLLCSWFSGLELAARQSSRSNIFPREFPL